MQTQRTPKAAASMTLSAVPPASGGRGRLAPRRTLRIIVDDPDHLLSAALTEVTPGRVVSALRRNRGVRPSRSANRGRISCASHRTESAFGDPSVIADKKESFP